MLLQVQRVSRSVLPRLHNNRARGNWASTEALGKEDQLWGNNCYKDHQLKSDSEWKL